MASTSPEEHLANASATTSVDTAATPSPSSPPPPPSGKGKKQGSVADRVAWLQSGRAFAKDADSPSKRDLGLESSTSVSDRKRWMEEGAFRKHLEDRGYVADGSDVSGASLVEERRRWLHEQAERNRLENERNQINKAGGSPRGANTNAAMNKSEANKAEEEDKAETEDSAEPPVLVEEEEEEEEETEPTPPAKNDEEQNGEEKAETEASAVAAAVVVSPSPQRRPSSQDPPPTRSDLLTKTTASAMNRATETDGRVGSPAARAMPCLFSSPVFAQQRDQMEFFLPAACSCPKCRAELAAAAPADEVAGTVQDPTALQTILRPWQVEFLQEEGIETTGELVDVEKDADRRQRLCRHMKRWRKERDLPAKTISCLMAVRIWAKTSEEALKNANASSTSAK